MHIATNTKISELFGQLEQVLRLAEYNVVRIKSTVPPYDGSEVTALQVGPINDYVDREALRLIIKNSMPQTHWLFDIGYEHEGLSVIKENPLSKDDADLD